MKEKMNTIQNENELYHYGVLGMKWGKRKALKREYKRDINKAYNKYDNAMRKAGNDVNKTTAAAKTLKLEKAQAKAKYKAAKPKMDTSTKIAIGNAAATTALAAIGATLVYKTMAGVAGFVVDLTNIG